MGGVLPAARGVPLRRSCALQGEPSATLLSSGRERPFRSGRSRERGVGPQSLRAGEAATGWQNLAFYSGEVYGGNGTELTVFDWNKTTIVAMYDGGAPYDHGKMQCVAHAHKTRIVDWNVASVSPTIRPRKVV